MWGAASDGPRASLRAWKVLTSQRGQELAQTRGFLDASGVCRSRIGSPPHRPQKKSATWNPEPSAVWGRQCLYIPFAFRVRLGCRRHFHYFSNNDHEEHLCKRMGGASDPGALGMASRCAAHMYNKESMAERVFVFGGSLTPAAGSPPPSRHFLYCDFAH